MLFLMRIEQIYIDHIQLSCKPKKQLSLRGKCFTTKGYFIRKGR